MNKELDRVRRARLDKEHHANYVTDEIGKIIRESAKEYPEEPVKSLGYAISEISNTIFKSFDNLDKIESNILVTINAYARVKNLFIAHENERMQLEAESSISKPEEESSEDKEPKDDSKSRKIRKVGERPERIDRKKPKPRKKTSSRSKKKKVKKEESD